MSEMIIIDPVVAFFQEPNIPAHLKGLAIESLVCPEMADPPELGPSWQFLRKQNAAADEKAQEKRNKERERLQKWREKKYETFQNVSKRFVRVNVNENENENENDDYYRNRNRRRAREGAAPPTATATATDTGDFSAMVDTSQRESPKVCEFDDLTPEHFRSGKVAVLFLAATVTGDTSALARHAWEKQRKRIGEERFRETLETFWHEMRAGEIPGNPAAAFTARLKEWEDLSNTETSKNARRGH